MASQNSSGVRPLDFPSGSNWGPKELEAVRFALEHEEQEFETFDCVVTLSNANVRVQDRLSSVFAMPVESLLDDGITEPYIEHRRFYERLAAVLKPKALPDTPSKSLNRSEIRHNTSSPFTNEGQPKTPTAVPSDFGSPESSPAAGVSKRKIRTRTTTTPPSRELGRAISTSPERAPTESPPGYMVDEALPVIPGGEHGVSSEKPLLASHSSSGQFYPAFNDDRTSFKLDREPGTSSSQTSSFRSLSSPSLPSESVPYSDADVLEDEIVELFFQFLVSICAEHKKTDGISFITDHGKDLVVIIDGEIVHTRPDLTVSVTLSGKTVPIPILDYEGKRLSGKPKFAQRVSEMLGRCSSQKANHNNKSSYTPYLISAQHTEVCISTCKLRDSYLAQLNFDSAELRSREPIQVTQYGPIDIRDPENRVLAAQHVYKLMLHLAERTRKDRVRG